MTGSDGTIYRDGPGGGRGRSPDPRHGDSVVRSALPDGSTLILVGDDDEVSSALATTRVALPRSTR